MGLCLSQEDTPAKPRGTRKDEVAVSPSAQMEVLVDQTKAISEIASPPLQTETSAQPNASTAEAAEAPLSQVTASPPKMESQEATPTKQAQVPVEVIPSSPAQTYIPEELFLDQTSETLSSPEDKVLKDVHYATEYLKALKAQNQERMKQAWEEFQEQLDITGTQSIAGGEGIHILAEEYTVEVEERPGFHAQVMELSAVVQQLDGTSKSRRFLADFASKFIVSEEKVHFSPSTGGVTEMLSKHMLDRSVILVDKFSDVSQQVETKREIRNEEQLIPECHWGVYLKQLISYICSCIMDEVSNGTGHTTWKSFMANPSVAAAEHRFEIIRGSQDNETPTFKTWWRTTILPLPQTQIKTLAFVEQDIAACQGTTTQSVHTFVTTPTFSGGWIYVFRNPDTETFQDMVVYCPPDLGYSDALALNEEDWPLYFVLVDKPHAAELRNREYERLNGNTKWYQSPNTLVVFYGVRDHPETHFKYGFSTYEVGGNCSSQPIVRSFG